MNNLIVYLAISLLFYGINLLIPVFMKRTDLFGVRIAVTGENEPFINATKR